MVSYSLIGKDPTRLWMRLALGAIGLRETGNKYLGCGMLVTSDGIMCRPLRGLFIAHMTFQSMDSTFCIMLVCSFGLSFYARANLKTPPRGNLRSKLFNLYLEIGTGALGVMLLCDCFRNTRDRPYIVVNYRDKGPSQR